MGTKQNARYRIVAALAACAIALTPATVAFADDNTDLESLQNAAIAAGDAYQQAQDRVDDLQNQIQSNQSKVDELNAQLPELRDAASKAIRTQYKLSQDQPNLIAMLLSSKDLTQFIAQLHYLDSVASSNADAINSLSQAQSDLETTQATLNSQLQQADSEKQAAQQAMEDAQAKAEAAEEKAREDAAANQAAYEAAQAAGQQDPTVSEIQNSASDTSSDTSSQDASSQQTTDAGSSSDSSQQSNQSASTNSDSSSQSQSSSSSSNSGSSSSSSGSSSSNSSSGSKSSGSSSSSSSSSASFTYVEASEYGNGDGCMYSATASGDIVTPTSMGVAMKTMPLGTVIEITYNGRTVTAVVNDRGPYVGNRQIDLQPAVAAALGFDGVGTVGYRVVG